MRIIVYGVGAIGGVLAAQLRLAGHEVVGIARGRQLETLRRLGITLTTPDRRETARFPVHEDPRELGLTPADFILLTMKSQDTAGALSSLKAAGAFRQPIFCFQNGVANEPLALRFFENVYGVTVMMPAQFTEPGKVAAFSTPKSGIFDIGRYPAGTDCHVDSLCSALNGSGFLARPRADVMNSKYRKLLSNLANIVRTVFAENALRQKWQEKLRAEAEIVLTAAGIAWDKGDPYEGTGIGEKPVPGVERLGSSTMQSAVRGTGSLETDYLNGEIALLARLHGLEAPANTAFCTLSQKLASGELPPLTATEEMTLAEMTR